MLQTANVLKSNFTRPIGCRVLAVKCSKNDHLNLEECTRQLTRMMGLMSSDSACLLVLWFQTSKTSQGTMSDSTSQSSSRSAKSGKFTSLSRAIMQAQWHSSWSSFSQNRKSFEYFLCFHLGISPKDFEGFKADITFIYTTLACSLTIWTLIWLL